MDVDTLCKCLDKPARLTIRVLLVLVSETSNSTETAMLSGGKTCDDNQLREDKEDICKEAQARQVGQAGHDKGEKRDGDNEERAKVHPHLPLHGVILLEDALEG